MKPKRAKCLKRCKAALYPTWFRWNRCEAVSRGWLCLLYIPHGSDETVAPTTEVILQESLYPTWFRWNNSIIFLTITKSSLYIPHGSDETLMTCYWRWWTSILYIPHGSDETEDAKRIKVKTSDFISHMVQMKPIVICKLIILTELYIPHGSDETAKQDQ